VIAGSLGATAPPADPTVEGVARDVVFVSLVTWDHMPFWRWRSLFRVLQAAGHRVLWVDHFSAYGTLRSPTRPRVRQVERRLWLLSSPALARLTSSPLRGPATAVAVAGVRRAVRQLEFERPLLWIAGPPGRVLRGQLGERAVLYDLSDDLSRLGAGGRLLADEQALLAEADLVWACSPSLASSKAAVRTQGLPIFTVPNGVDPDAFRTVCDPGPIHPALSGPERPVVGYHGTIYDRIDWQLVDAVARAEPGWRFAFLGTVEQRPPIEIRALPNVVFLPPEPFEQVPAFYRGCDVCWIPHRAGALAQQQSSTKLLEYLATGRPAVATEMLMDEDVAPLVGHATDWETMRATIHRELAEDGGDRRRARREVAARHSWTERFEELRSHLRGGTAA
jgi:glycosyltransferase involved in cell wall biosynthesis